MLPHGRLPLPTLSSGPSSGSLSAPGREDSATQSEWRRLRHRETSNWVGERRPAAAFSGVDIGDWKARRCLGKNAFGEVHEAENVLTRRRAALRLLHPYWSVDVRLVEGPAFFPLRFSIIRQERCPCNTRHGSVLRLGARVRTLTLLTNNLYHTHAMLFGYIGVYMYITTIYNIHFFHPYTLSIYVYLKRYVLTLRCAQMSMGLVKDLCD